MSETVTSRHSPFERKAKEEIDLEVREMGGAPFLRLFPDFPVFVLITNDCRQIVWANQEALKIIGVSSLPEAAGKRPGEALGCLHASECLSGCGTTEFCVFCGAGRSLESALNGVDGVEECVIRRDRFHDFDSLDLLIWAKPFDLAGKRYVAFAARDHSSQKRREVLERVFYHDILNTAATIKSLTGLIGMTANQPENREYLELADETADRLVEEIASQRSLKEAEDGDLAVTIAPVSADRILDEALAPFRVYFREKSVTLNRSAAAGGPPILTDPVLARRVVSNMVKNALEASGKGDRIDAGVENNEDSAEIWVRNPAVLSEEERKRIFHRSFSTKGVGRGLGTYGMKLLAERYLGGEVRFESQETVGTTFRIRLPREPSR